jgi:hypothetical protein
MYISETILCVCIFSNFSPLRTSMVFVQQLKSGQRMYYDDYYCTFTSQRRSRTNQGRTGRRRSDLGSAPVKMRLPASEAAARGTQQRLDVAARGTQQRPDAAAAQWGRGPQIRPRRRRREAKQRRRAAVGVDHMLCLYRSSGRGLK